VGYSRRRIVLWRSDAIRLVEARKTDCGMDGVNGESVCWASERADSRSRLMDEKTGFNGSLGSASREYK
jgi:hypothetical protein